MGVLEQFDDAVRPVRRLINNLLEQNAVLREARDLLLPRLVSGELDVSGLGLGSGGGVSPVGLTEGVLVERPASGSVVGVGLGGGVWV